MLNSPLAILLKSHKPQAIEPIASQKFLANVAMFDEDAQLRARLLRFAETCDPKKQANKQPSKKADSVEVGDDMVLTAPPAPWVTSDGIGVIPVFGVIGKGLSFMEKCLGCTDIDDIVNTMRMWENNDAIQEIVLHFNSGGGTTSGLQETARFIREYSKPTIAWADEDCGSAAFWLASQCKRVVVTPSASIGSIGIFVSITDESAKFAAEGKQVVVIKSGEYKGAGIEGTSLTEKQVAWIQDEVVELHKRFISDVLASRPYVSLDDMQGQSFYGDIAAQKGLATGLADNFDELLDSIRNVRIVVKNEVAQRGYGEIA